MGSISPRYSIIRYESAIGRTPRWKHLEPFWKLQIEIAPASQFFLNLKFEYLCEILTKIKNILTF